MGTEWTTTPPTEPGLYWAWDGERVLAITVGYDEHVDGLWAFEQQSQYGSRLNSYSHWLGPLPVPEPPKA